MLERKLILRGLLSGLVAGVLAFVFARIFAEPQIDKAVAYEEGRGAVQEALDRAAGLPVPAAEAETVSRTVQSGVGIGVGIIAFAIAIGGLYALAYTFCYGRFGAVRARTLALVVALCGFLAAYLVPFLKYPANPPAVGNGDTIEQRTSLYLTMLGLSLVLAVAAVVAGRALHRRHSAYASTLLASLGFAVAIGIVMLLLPSLGDLAANKATFGAQGTETPQPLTDPGGRIVYPAFPADVLYFFRFYSVGAQLIVWGGIGLVFGALAERLLEPERRQARVSAQSAQKPASGATR